MKSLWSLAIVALAYFFLRLRYEAVQQALMSTLFQVPFMCVAWVLGGWTSFGSALAWARSHRILTMLELVMVLCLLGLGLFGAMHPPLFLLSEVIAAYFFLHAFGALGAWLQQRFARAA